MLRIVLEDGEQPNRLLEEEAFTNEIQRLQEIGFRGAPPGPLRVECLDVDGGVRWRAFFREYTGLVDLARQLLRERAMGAAAAHGALDERASQQR